MLPDAERLEGWREGLMDDQEGLDWRVRANSSTRKNVRPEPKTAEPRPVKAERTAGSAEVAPATAKMTPPTASATKTMMTWMSVVFGRRVVAEAFMGFPPGISMGR